MQTPARRRPLTLSPHHLVTLSLLTAALALAAAPATPPAAIPPIPTPPPPTTPTAPSSWPHSPIAPGEKPVKLADGFSFTEGSTSDEQGNIYFVDQPKNRIMEWSVGGQLSTFLQPSGYSNGMSFDNQGNLITCADEKNELWLIAAPFPARPAATTQPFKPADLKITILIHDYDGKNLNPPTGGKPLNGPNDVWVIPTGPLAGGMYITDPLYSRAWWTNRPGGRGVQQAGRFVLFLSPDHKTLTPVITDFRQPNGIIGTPDSKTLYVSDIDGHRTFSYSINNDGTLADKKLFCNAGSDGMTIDSDGNIYTTGSQFDIRSKSGTTDIWNKNGDQIDSIRTPRNSANICFGGPDGHLLFICAGNEVYGVKMTTHRVGPQ